jgi:hypothetical protein
VTTASIVCFTLPYIFIAGDTSISRRAVTASSVYIAHSVDTRWLANL